MPESVRALVSVMQARAAALDMHEAFLAEDLTDVVLIGRYSETKELVA